MNSLSNKSVSIHSIDICDSPVFVKVSCGRQLVANHRCVPAAPCRLSSSARSHRGTRYLLRFMGVQAATSSPPGHMPQAGHVGQPSSPQRLRTLWISLNPTLPAALVCPMNRQAEGACCSENCRSRPRMLPLLQPTSLRHVLLVMLPSAAMLAD